MNIQLPQCPLEYQVPTLPATHTALVLPISTADIDWQEKILPWTLASLINNTDIVLQGVRLIITCEHGTEERIHTALQKFDLPDNTIITRPRGAAMLCAAPAGRYETVCIIDINYWAFRGISRQQEADIKLPLGHILRRNWGWGAADYNLHHINDIEHFVDASKRTEWLQDANRAVYGEDSGNRTVAPYFFNENEANWLIDTSILHFRTAHITAEMHEWLTEHQHLGTDACIALWLLKTHQHVYSFRDSITIEKRFTRAAYPRLCNMKRATNDAFRSAIKGIMGSHLNVAM
jgi:hypothetical protein